MRAGLTRAERLAVLRSSNVSELIEELHESSTRNRRNLGFDSAAAYNELCEIHSLTGLKSAELALVEIESKAIGSIITPFVTADLIELSVTDDFNPAHYKGIGVLSTSISTEVSSSVLDFVKSLNFNDSVLVKRQLRVSDYLSYLSARRPTQIYYQFIDTIRSVVSSLIISSQNKSGRGNIKEAICQWDDFSGLKSFLPAPSLYLYAGGGIIRDREFLLQNTVLNCHLGILPFDRGMGNVEAAIFEGRYGDIGCTVHRMTSDLDKGPILLRYRPGIQEFSLEGLYRRLRNSTRIAFQVALESSRRASIGIRTTELIDEVSHTNQTPLSYAARTRMRKFVEKKILMAKNFHK